MVAARKRVVTGQGYDVAMRNDSPLSVIMRRKWIIIATFALRLIFTSFSGTEQAA